MKKMIINSFYNTLIDKEDAIPLSTMLEIERVRKNNYKFVKKIILFFIISMKNM